MIEVYYCKDSCLREIERTLNASQEKISLLKELNLDGQVDMFCNPYPKLTREELDVWMRFLPRSYRGETGLGLYAFDMIPTEVLQEWVRAKSYRFFTDFEIRTPERAISQDPILCGLRDKAEGGYDRYLIARWGESLLPFSEIQELVRPWWKKLFAKKV